MANKQITPDRTNDGLMIDGTKVLGEQMTHIVSLTDNSGGTGTDTIAAIGASYSQTEVRNAVASLADKIQEIILVLEGHGLTASS